MGAATPRPGNGGQTAAAYCQFSAELRDDLGGASRALTPAAPSLGIRWPPTASRHRRFHMQEVYYIRRKMSRGRRR